MPAMMPEFQQQANVDAALNAEIEEGMAAARGTEGPRDEPMAEGAEEEAGGSLPGESRAGDPPSPFVEMREEVEVQSQARDINITSSPDSEERVPPVVLISSPEEQAEVLPEVEVMAREEHVDEPLEPPAFREEGSLGISVEVGGVQVEFHGEGRPMASGEMANMNEWLEMDDSHFPASEGHVADEEEAGPSNIDEVGPDFETGVPNSPINTADAGAGADASPPLSRQGSGEARGTPDSGVRVYWAHPPSARAHRDDIIDWRTFEVPSEVAGFLEKVWAEHPDFCSGVIPQTGFVRTALMQGVHYLLEWMQRQSPDQLRIEELPAMVQMAQDFQILGFHLDWVSDQLGQWQEDAELRAAEAELAEKEAERAKELEIIKKAEEAKRAIEAEILRVQELIAQRKAASSKRAPGA